MDKQISMIIYTLLRSFNLDEKAGTCVCACVCVCGKFIYTKSKGLKEKHSVPTFVCASVFCDICVHVCWITVGKAG